MTLRFATKWLLVLALALPVVQAVLVWIRALLNSMNDAEGAEIIAGVGTICQVVWSVSLVGLLIVLALATLNEPPHHSED
jgi:hypothetical protein